MASRKTARPQGKREEKKRRLQQCKKITKYMTGIREHKGKVKRRTEKVSLRRLIASRGKEPKKGRKETIGKKGRGPEKNAKLGEAKPRKKKKKGKRTQRREGVPAGCKKNEMQRRAPQNHGHTKGARPAGRKTKKTKITRQGAGHHKEHTKKKKES